MLFHLFCSLFFVQVFHMIMQGSLEVISLCSFSESYANKCVSKTTTYVLFYAKNKISAAINNSFHRMRLSIP
uniref:Secreted protein n=1 Tax=Lotus japonicus TaxID=34305 RepID=I3SAQ4_LOTJA|nr:unknown [Lotus japonicus]